MVDGFRPETLREALKLRKQYDCLPIAGGTDLMVQKARGFALKPDFEKPLLFIGHLPELHKIVIEKNQIHIGAGVLLTDLVNSDIIPEIFKEAVCRMASPASRNLASLGGNICNASPAGDTLPYLYAVDAKLVLKSVSSERIVPIGEFITGPKQTDLEHAELLTEIIIPNKLFNVNYYRKVGQRKGMSLTKAAFLGMADVENRKLTDIRIAFGSVAQTVVRSREIETDIIGKSSGEYINAIPTILKQYAPLIRPIDDARSSAIYRKKVSLRLLEDFLMRLN
ncbi:MAG: FAD binding domain-containing protein [Candidatus Marinimicrobia bacterium]|nr:FAD binding domain-containing protein [Candidatus Neomarinimicrobiota bacterium]